MTGAVAVSVVLPVYNEEENLAELHNRLTKTLEPLEILYEVIFVDDGSSDGSRALMRLLRYRDPHVKIIVFSRNFGHQAAVSAGIDQASGDAVVVMDADLQDPPEVVPRLIEEWKTGYDVVYAVRRKRKESLVKRMAYAGFYRLIHRLSETALPLDSGDFSIMDRRVADLLSELPERNRYVRGLRAWAGFRQKGIEYERGERFAGSPKYDLRQLVKLAYDGILSFSHEPLRIAMRLGLVITAVASVLAAWTFLKRVFNYEVVPGFATITLLVLFFGGVQLVTIGILGEYIARIYTEVKGRPNYVVCSREGFDSDEEEAGERNMA